MDEISLVPADSFEDLVRPELATLHRRAFRMTHEHEAAQDLVQDTLERAYRKLDRFQSGSNIRAWLLCIMRNIWISAHRRRAGAFRMVSLDQIDEARPYLDDVEPPGAADVESAVVDDLGVASIHTAIDGLPSHLRQVVVLADVEETPYGAIAAVLAIPIGTVASRLSRGRRRLRVVLSDQALGADYLARAG
jgi:RNA polymerase sigma-70 factor (ECF subfamily)